MATSISRAIAGRAARTGFWAKGPWRGRSMTDHRATIPVTEQQTSMLPGVVPDEPPQLIGHYRWSRRGAWVWRSV